MAKKDIYSKHHDDVKVLSPYDRAMLRFAAQNPKVAKQIAVRNSRLAELMASDPRFKGTAGTVRGAGGSPPGSSESMEGARRLGAQKRGKQFDMLRSIAGVVIFLLIFGLALSSSGNANTHGSSSAQGATGSSYYTYTTTVPQAYSTTTQQYNNTTGGAAYGGRSSVNGTSCSSYFLYSSSYTSTVNGTCSWTGGTLSITAGGGDSGYLSVKIKGLSTGTLYYSNSTANWCAGVIGSVDLPAQSYLISMRTGRGGGSCEPGSAELLLTQQ